MTIVSQSRSKITILKKNTKHCPFMDFTQTRLSAVG